VGRPIICLWRYLVPAALPVVALGGLVVIDGAQSRLLPVAAVVVVIGLVRSRWAWRLALRVHWFRTLGDDRVRLHYDPAAAGRYDLPALARQCGADLDRLAAWFGRPLRGRPAMFLFADSAPIARLFGPEYGGTALAPANAILVAAGGPIRETVRHELAHLFGARWNPLAPPLLSEGLAVWLQGTDQGELIDAAAWPWIREPGLGLRALLNPRVFFDVRHRHACYLLAGSFTGFLLRRHGKAAYRRLYGRLSGRRFEREFRDCLGASLEAAERAWRAEVLSGGPLGRRAGSAESPWAAEPQGAPDTGPEIG
jgi:hypothetical protein